jgi:hypothetical protein
MRPTAWQRIALEWARLRKLRELMAAAGDEPHTTIVDANLVAARNLFFDAARDVSQVMQKVTMEAGVRAREVGNRSHRAHSRRAKEKSDAERTEIKTILSYLGTRMDFTDAVEARTRLEGLTTQPTDLVAFGANVYGLVTHLVPTVHAPSYVGSYDLVLNSVVQGYGSDWDFEFSKLADAREKFFDALKEFDRATAVHRWAHDVAGHFQIPIEARADSSELRHAFDEAAQNITQVQATLTGTDAWDSRAAASEPVVDPETDNPGALPDLFFVQLELSVREAGE